MSGDVLLNTAASLTVSGSATILALLIGLPLASICARNDFAGKRGLRVLVRTLYGLPPVVVGVVVYLALSRKGPMGGLELLFTLEGMIIAQTLLILPLVWGLSWGALEKIPKQVLETHGMIGRKSGIITHLREARGGVINAVLVGFGRAIAEVGAVMVVGGNIAGKTRVLTTSIVMETSQGDLKAAMVLGSILLSIALLASALALIIEEGWVVFSTPQRNIVEPDLKLFGDFSVKVDSLSWNIETNTILSDVSLEIEGGECVAILGTSGSGKSSLLRHISKLESGGSGTITTMGGIMMVHQHPVVLFGSVLTNVCHTGVSEEVAMWWLEQVGLEAMAERDPSSLSGGERQRLSMARALSLQPDLLILDEFTANLDGPNVSTLEKLVRGHLDRGGGVIMATHNPFQAKRMANDLIVLDEGKVVSDDSEISQALLSGSWLG